jgi:hypothetical protein
MPYMIKFHEILIISSGSFTTVDSILTPTNIRIPPIKSSSSDSYNTTATFNPLLLQPNVLDYDDAIPPPLDNPTYVDLQSCSSYVMLDQKQSIVQSTPNDKQNTNKTPQNDLIYSKFILVTRKIEL